MNLHEILDINEHQVITSKKYTVISENQRNNQVVLPSGSRNFDEIVGGGFYSGKKYLIFGANKTGKTQLCHQLCVQAYKQFVKTSDEKKIKSLFYLDTENTFRPERIEELVGSTGLKLDNILKMILVSKIMSNSALLLALKDFESIIAKNRGSILIIDTINNYFRSEVADKNISFYKTIETFLKVLRKLNELTNTYNLISITTAQVTPNFSTQTIIRELPVANQFLNHFFSEYIYLSIKDEGKCYSHLVNSLKTSEKRLLYEITSHGIQDYKV